MEQIAMMFGIKRNNNKGDLGFTLVELLIVIAIIGIIAGIGIPMFLGQRTKALKSEATTNLQVLYTLQEQYYAEYGRYAPWPDKTDPNSLSNTFYKATYGVNDNGCEDYLPQFKPGPRNELNFDYWCKSAAGGSQFQIAAVGKASTAVEGSIIFLNSRNEWEKL